MDPVITITAKCPNCGKRCRWTVPTASTEIRRHTCRRGTDLEQPYVVKISQGRPVTVKGRAAVVQVISWNPVVKE